MISSLPLPRFHPVLYRSILVSLLARHSSQRPFEEQKKKYSNVEEEKKKEQKGKRRARKERRENKISNEGKETTTLVSLLLLSFSFKSPSSHPLANELGLDCIMLVSPPTGTLTASTGPAFALAPTESGEGQGPQSSPCQSAPSYGLVPCEAGTFLQTILPNPR
jgi:hypothetical protein